MWHGLGKEWEQMLFLAFTILSLYTDRNGQWGPLHPKIQPSLAPNVVGLNNLEPHRLHTCLNESGSSSRVQRVPLADGESRWSSGVSFKNPGPTKATLQVRQKAEVHVVG
jgi:hypothetical protein